MSTACDNFKPHRWKPRQCAACFKPKAEHSGVTTDEASNDLFNNNAKAKQSPYYKRFSFTDENNVDQKASSRDGGEPAIMAQTGQQSASQSTAPTSRDAVATSMAIKSEKPDSGNEADETHENHSSSLPAAVVESTNSEPVPTKQTIVNDNIDDNSRVTSEATSDNSDMSGKTPPRPPPPRVRSHTMAVPQVKPRKHIPEPSAELQFSTKTVSRDLQPIPAPRRNRANRSTSPMATSNSLDGESSVSRAKSLDNLDVSPPDDRKVKFKLETTTIPDPDTSPTAARKSGMIEPYAVSDVTDILQKASTMDKVAVEKKKGTEDQLEENDEHEYIEADQLHAAVVSVSELKNKHRNGKPSQVTKYSTLSTLQPTQQQNGKLIMGTKQKAMSSGTMTTTKTTPRRHAPPPPGAPRSRSATIASVDKVRMQNYSTPRRPPPPSALYYTNANVVNLPKANATPVAKVPPPKPLRTPSTFDYENVNGTVTTEPVEYSVLENDKEAAATSTSTSRPKKPVRMPKEASPVSDGGQQASKPKGRYIDLDIDQLNDQQMAGRPVMKYQNFDDFSPRSFTPERSRTPDFDSLVTLPLEGASQVHDAILNNLNVASAELTKFYFREFSYVGKVSCSKWSDFDPAPPGITGCVKYNGKLLSLQDISKERVDGEKATPLPPHPNICRAMAFFADNPPSKLVHKFKIKKGRIAAITDPVPTATVAEFVKQNFVSMKQLEYDRHVLLILVQLFSALKHLQQNGTVHRDLSAETCRYDPKSGIMKLTDFTYALHRPPPITSSTFVYGYGDLKWLGGTGSKLPPEIINTPDDCQTLDYSMSDCFAAGCMIYELFGMQPPFDKDEKLISKNYTRRDLVHIPKRSQYSNLINQLIHLLVQVDKSKRIKPHNALLLVQAILWGPVSWLHDTVSEAAIQNYLAVEKARLVTSVALNSLKGDGKPSVELMLKNMFIQECNPTNMINALSLLNTE